MTIEPGTFSKIEQEAIILGAVIGMIDDMVNHTIFCAVDDKRTDTNLLPQSAASLRQFGTLLRDFLSPVVAKGKGPLPFGLPKPVNGNNAVDHTTLYYLRQVCDKPLIAEEIAHLQRIAQDFGDWLDDYAVVDGVWLANIDVSVNLRIKRIDFIRMSGDIGKHNFLRLGGQASRLRSILAENGVVIDESDAYLALPDCWDWFQTNLLAYHASTIAEFLNDIRYAIRLYIAPVAKASYQVTGNIDGMERFTFHRPKDLVNTFAWAHYLNLLQGSLKRANFPPFSVARSMKMRF